MKNHLLLFALLASFLVSCNTKSKTANLIDYQSLEEIDTEVLLEIGESESYLPGSLNELVVSSDGSILVSDWASVTIEQFDSTGKHIETVAKEGGGPGELSNYFDMRDMGNGTILVSHQGGQRDFFAQGENGTFEIVESVVPDEGVERPITIIGARTDTTFYATAGFLIQDVQKFLKKAHNYRMNSLVITSSADKILKDSVHMLKSPGRHVVQIDGGISLYSIPYRNEDRFLPMNNGKYMIARPDSSAFFIYNSSHKLHRRIPLNVKPRPVEEPDLEHALKDIDEPARSDIENLVHEVKPPYLNIWVTDNHIWLHTDTGEKGKEVAVLDFDGNPLGKFLLPDVDEINHIEGERVYTIHRSPETGNTIRVYRVNV